MTIAGRFQAALQDIEEPGLAGRELLPVRLAIASARALQVDAAGISLLDTGQQPLPLGASSAAGAVAERLQVAAREGPCLTAQENRQPVFALDVDLRRRWPVFSELLLADTPFRAVVVLPLQPALVGTGALDLYFRRPTAVIDLDVFEALAVGEFVRSALSDAEVSPAEGHRAVWEAMSRVGAELDVDAPTARSLLRAHASAGGGSVDDVAADLLAGRLRVEELRPPGVVR